MSVSTQALIFDMDGVLTADTAEYHFLSWKRLAEEENIPFTREDNEQLRGVTRRESLTRFLKGRSIDEAMAQAWMERKNAYFHELLQTLTLTNRLPGVTEFLEEARAMGLKMGVASASRNVQAVLSRLELISYFDAIGDGNTVANTKPAPDIFIWVAGRLNVRPQDSIVFEDSEAGVEAARASGFRVVGIGGDNLRRAHIVVSGLLNVTVSEILNRIETL